MNDGRYRRRESPSRTLGTTSSQVSERAAEERPEPGQVQNAVQPRTNPVERAVRRLDCWQQRHTVIAFPIAVVKKFGDDQAGNVVSLLAYYSFLAAFPLLLAFTAVLGVALRRHPELHEKLVNSAFAEFPIVGGQMHEQLGVEAFSGTFPSLMIGIAGAVLGGRGFAHALQNTLNTVWAVPKVDRPGFFPRYLRTISLLLLLSLIVLVTGAASTAAGTATSLGVGGLPARIVSLAVGTALGFGFFLVLFRVAASGQVSTRSMLFGAAISALGWQILLTVPGSSSPTNCATPRRSPDCSVSFSGCSRGWRFRQPLSCTRSRPTSFAPDICGPGASSSLR